MVILWLALKVVGAFLIVHFLTFLVAILTAKLEKNADGNLVLDTNCWHFKAAYPFRRRRYGLCYVDLNICPYFLKLTFMIYVGWPCMILYEGLRTAIGNILIVPFGLYYRPDIKKLEYNAAPWELDAEDFPWLPKIKQFVLRPAYILYPFGYFLLYRFYRTGAIRVAISAAVIALIIATILGYFYVYYRLENFKDQRVSLVREFISGKYRKVCRKIVLKTS